jgi:hypothetical protein
MKRLVLASLFAGCTSNADIGISNQPVTCKPAAAGAANGTVTNASTHQSYTFGAVDASLAPTAIGTSSVLLQDQSLSLQLQFNCGMATGMYDVGATQAACPFLVVPTVSGTQQQVYGVGGSGVVIIDQNTGCLAGRYDIDFHVPLNNTFVDEGSIAGWFSVPLQ